MNIDKDAVLQAFEYLLLKEANFEDLPQEWLDVREKMIPVINEAFCCGCEFVEKKILEGDAFDCIGKKGEYSEICVTHFYEPLLPLFESILPIQETWLKFDPTNYNPELFKGTMIINSKNNSISIIIDLPEEKALEIGLKENHKEGNVEYCALIHYKEEEMRQNKIYRGE